MSTQGWSHHCQNEETVGCLDLTLLAKFVDMLARVGSKLLSK